MLVSACESVCTPLHMHTHTYANTICIHTCTQCNICTHVYKHTTTHSCAHMCTMYTHMYTYTRLCTLPLHNQRPSTFPPRRSFPQGATSWRSKGETTGARRRKLAGQEAKCLWTEGEIIQEPTGPPTPQIVKPTHGNRTRLPVMLSLPR